MNELKAETIVPQGTTITLQMYSKSEVDKVIVEKDEELRRQKYKRCLAMARWCHTNDQMMSRLYKEACIVKIQGRDSYFFQARWWEKWHKRWLELAENFEEARNG